MPNPTFRLTLFAIAVILAACGDGAFGDSTIPNFIAPPDTALGGDGLPVLDPGQPISRTSVPISGAFSLEENGCWTADLGDNSDRVVIFPAGYDKPSDDAAVMRGPEGTIVADGLAFDGFGAVVPAATLPGYPDGYWGNYLSFCDPDGLEVLIFTEIRPAFHPTTLAPADLSGLVSDADFTESWPCGVGFAISDRLQRVAVELYATDSDVASESPVTLPGTGWSAQIVVGNHLMSNHCNDAIETWTAARSETARWDIVEGVLDFAPRVNDPCSGANAVTGILRNGVVDTPTGRVTLPDLHIVNRAFGCFAG